LAVLADYLPSVCVLGHLSPVRLHALPFGWCRWRGPTAADAVTFTFDDGPSPKSTPRTLDLLDLFGMRATFFVLGTQAESNSDLVSEILRRGHSVGSHGYLHEHHLLRSPAWIRDDLNRSVASIEAVTGRRPRWYRPSYGQLTAATVVQARRHDMEVVLWSAWGREWAEPGPAPVIARIERHLEPGAIVLLHDNEVSCPPGTAARTHAVLGPLADKLDELGLRAVTLDDLFAQPAR
jgi:peptidoglycan/xylan/chitin deacetylase (PgdA/CDA1 family)